MRVSLKLNSDLFPEIDYQALMAELHHLSHPRRKLKELQNKGLLIRLKKGFYVLSSELIGKEYSPEIVANLLYGPSYLSLEYALSYYHLIPERVEHFTSVTTQKNKVFPTPLGHFIYQHISPTLYHLGVTLQKTSDHRTYHMASVEKALMDVFTLRFNNSTLPKKKDVEMALKEDLRIDLIELKNQLNRESLLEMKEYYRNRRWNKLVLEFLLEDL
jgi:predicted transcriptional regulator of viral defense system